MHLASRTCGKTFARYLSYDARRVSDFATNCTSRSGTVTGADEKTTRERSGRKEDAKLRRTMGNLEPLCPRPYLNVVIYFIVRFTGKYYKSTTHTMGSLSRLYAHLRHRVNISESVMFTHTPRTVPFRETSSSRPVLAATHTHTHTHSRTYAEVHTRATSRCLCLCRVSVAHISIEHSSPSCQRRPVILV